MDPLSEVLRSVRLMGGVFLDANFSSPWCVLSQITPDVCEPVIGKASQLIGYHYVLEGTMLCGVEGGSPEEVKAGEIVMLPRNDVHILGSEEGLPPVRGDDMLRSAMVGGFARLNLGGGGATTHFVCGYLGTAEQFNPLIASLPSVIKVNVADATSRDWVESSLRFAAAELMAGRLAANGILGRLAEVLLVEAVRQYVASDGAAEGWLRGLNDPQIGKALALIHQDLTREWTADDLAKAVALSRSVFMQRFTALVGMPPIRYLATWRMQSARLMLRETQKSVAQVAYAVGYDSEEAFSRAFKREYGMPPSQARGEPVK